MKAQNNNQIQDQSGNISKPMLAVDSFEWNSIYLKKPSNYQKVACRVKDSQGYTGECIYVNGFFETYEDNSNRFVITRWKCDEWAEI